MAKWSKKDKAAAVILIEEGCSDKSAAMEMGDWSLDIWMALRAVAEEEEGERERRKPDEAIFGGFKMRQQARLKALKDMSEGEKVPAPAEVSCVRASAEIDLQTLKAGQDIGIYRREPDRQEIGISAEVRAMTDEERREWFEADRRECFGLYEVGPGSAPWGRTTAQLRETTRGEADDSC